ncbi:uroporphyrinogen-III synthase [Virgibacillus sp. NKC19-16]|uniref:uroporphyrinogen-III synthase n=1 Tax=Virgibacillus salidurans TaxID=2831673 RepID=UPI001F42D485|nr:uroporphyrinogen-III synthase [Virgibacillus sp. NKC19-16]UJL47715.1 uroporphyrinogen-III synthase [Virgibacillus sp. NKC19-16]
MKGLEGKNIGVAATRKADEINKLIQNSGGTSRTFSIQGEQILNENISEQNVSELLTKPFDLALLTTGIGAETLEKSAYHMNRLPEFIRKMENIDLAVRGSKTEKWMKKHSMEATFVSKDGTMESMLEALAVEEPNKGKRLFLQAYNKDGAVLRQKLENRGYVVYLSKPYHYKEPDQTTLNNLRQEIINQSLDAVIFTSKTQVQNLFTTYSKTKEIVDSFNDKVLAVAVGKVTAKELEQHYVSTVFHPTKPKMGTMVIELGDYLTGNSN